MAMPLGAGDAYMIASNVLRYGGANLFQYGAPSWDGGAIPLTMMLNIMFAVFVLLFGLHGCDALRTFP